jgi:hypothetical protein
MDSFLDNAITYFLLACLAITVIIVRRDSKDMKTHVKGIHDSLNTYIEKERKR